MRTAVRPSTARDTGRPFGPQDMVAAVEVGVARGIKAGTAPTGSTRSRSLEYQDAFLKFIRTGRRSDELERRDLGTGTGAAGGFLIPPLFQRQLLKDAALGSALLGHTQIVDTSGFPSPGGFMTYPVLIDAAHTAAGIADTVAVGEVDAILGAIAWPQAVNYATGQIARVSRGLAQDSAFDLGQLLSQAWALRVQKSVEADMTAAVLTGVTQSVTCGTASVIKYADLLAAFFAISGAYRPGAVWVFSPAAHLALRTAADSQLRPLFVDSFQDADVDNQGNVQNAMRLLGCPVLESVAGFQNNFTSGGVIGAYLNVGKVLPVRFAGADISGPMAEAHADTGEITWAGWSRWNAQTVALASAGVLIKAA